MTGAKEDEPFRWVVRLSDKEPWKRYVVWAAAMVAAAAGWFWMGQALFALIGFVAVMASTAEYWMPIRNRLDAKGAHVTVGLSTTSLEWEQVRRAILDDEGVKLSPLAESGRMAPFRGVFVRFGAHREAVLAKISAYWGKDVQSVGERADGGGIRGADPESSEGDPQAEA